MVLVVVAGAAYAKSATQDPVYSASADVLLSRQNLAASLNNISDPGNNISDYNRVAQTQANLATAPKLIDRTLRSAGLPQREARSFEKNSSVKAEPNADILKFQVQDGDPKKAIRLASAYASSYTVYRRTIDTAGIARALREVRKRISALLRDAPADKQLITSLRGNEQRLSVLEALETSNAFLVRPPQSAKRVKPKPELAVGLGIFFGLLLGVGIALLRNGLDTRLRDPDEVSSQLGVPLLATIPRLRQGLKQKRDLVMLSDPSGQAAEASRILRTNVEFATVDKRARTIMVTSAVQAEGKSTTIANLALAFARGGRSVVLVDLDLRRPYLARFFGLEGSAGVTDVALGRVSLDECLTEIDLGPLTQARDPNYDVRADAAPVRRISPDNSRQTSLKVLPSGPMPPDPGEFLGGDRLVSILGELEVEADLVLVDAPPLLNVGDALILSARVDALLFVAQLGLVRRPMLKDARRALETSPARVLGCVVTGARPAQSYYSGYTYSATNETLASGSPLGPTADSWS